MTDGQRIEAICRAQGVPLAVLARRAGVSRRTIYNAIEGKPLTLDVRAKLARALSVPLRDISPAAADLIEATA